MMFSELDIELEILRMEQEWALRDTTRTDRDRAENLRSGSPAGALAEQPIKGRWYADFLLEWSRSL